MDTHDVHEQSQAAWDEAFIRYLRQRLGTDTLGFATPPTRLMGGFDTTIWAFELGGAPEREWRQPLVARVFRPGQAKRPRFEGVVHSAISAQGFPCPPSMLVEESDRPLGGPFMIMPRARGRPLLDFLPSATGWYRIPRLLAQTQLALHALDTDEILRQLAAGDVPSPPPGAGKWLTAAAVDVERDELRRYEPALRWVEAHLPPTTTPVVCHGDFHPRNLLAEKWQVTGVIDWGGVLIGDPELDVAFSRIIMTMGPIDGGALGGVLNRARSILVRLYEHEYRKHRPLDQEKLRYYEALRCFLAMVHAASARFAAGTGQAPGYAWANPRQVALMTRHFRAITGVELAAP